MKRGTSLCSQKWRDADTDGITDRFIKLRFSNTEEIMKCRVFDLLNIYSLSSARAEEMILALYRWYSSDPVTDEEVSAGIRKQDFDYAWWRRNHHDYSEVTVEDIVLQEGINRKAVLHLYGLVVRAFYKSDQYDGQEYKYFNYTSLKRSMENEQTGKEHSGPDLGESHVIDRRGSSIYGNRSEQTQGYDDVG